MYIITFSVYTLKNGAAEHGSVVTDMNPFEYIDNWNDEYIGRARAKITSYMECTKEYTDNEDRKRMLDKPTDKDRTS